MSLQITVCPLAGKDITLKLDENTKLLVDIAKHVSSMMNQSVTSEAVASRLNVLATVRNLMEKVSKTVDPERFKTVILAGSDINARNRWGSTALHIIAKSGNVPALHALLESNADVDIRDHHDMSPLDLADKTECQEELKAKGANGWTPLMLAAEKGDDSAVKALLEKSLNDLHRQNKQQRTALHAAAEEGHAHVLQTLISAKADLRVQDIDGRLPLQVATSDQCSELLARDEIGSVGSATLPDISPGSSVRLSISYRKWGDAAGGPLRPGDVGIVMENDKTDKPYRVQAPNSSQYWYVKQAVVQVQSASGPP